MGQTDIIQSTPKYGFSRRGLRNKFTHVPLGHIQRLLETGRLDASSTIGIRELYKAGVSIGPDGIVCTGKVKKANKQELLFMMIYYL